MDINNVSDVPQYMQLLLKQKQNLRNAKSRKGQRPKESKSRDEIILQFRSRLMMKLGRADLNTYNLRSSFIPPAYPPCITQASELTKFMIKDLVLETHHRGKYLLVGSITPPDKMSAIMAIVEDENKKVLMLQLYYQEDEKDRAAEEILPEGAILLVKEPYLKLMSDGDYGLRVDHLSDVKYLPLFDERVPNYWQQREAKQDDCASTWKAKGNEYFNMSKYESAIQHYTKALDCSPTEEEAQILRLNRSLAYLKTKQFDAALFDVNSERSSSKPVEKALTRKSQALYKLERYQECSEVIKALRTEYPGNLAAEAELTRAVNRLAEQEKGNYEFRQLIKEAAKLRPPLLDHSTYSAQVSVRASGSRGRGLFTTKEVRAGELLLCEKAFAHAFVDLEEEAHSQDLTLLINVETDSMTMGAQAELIRMIAQKMYRNPSLASTITDLHHGSYQPVNFRDVDGVPVVDTFLIERIIALNCFGCPLSSRESHLRAVEHEMSKKTKTDKEGFNSCGIWPLASYINHSCNSNARRAFIGDMMIVRATRDLAVDTEITFWYKMPEAIEYDERQKKLRNWGFKCDCTMCQDDKLTKKTVWTQRKNLKADALKCFQSGKRKDADKIQTILAAIASTYSRPAFEVPRLSLWDPQLALAKMYMQLKQPAKAIDSALKALESLGYVIEGGSLPRISGTPMVVKQWGLMIDHLLDCWMLLAGAYHLMAPDLGAQAVGYARISYKICVGEDETFDKTYGKLDR